MPQACEPQTPTADIPRDVFLSEGIFLRRNMQNEPVVQLGNGPLGMMEDYWVSELLGTGYKKFTSPWGVDGLAIVDGRRVDILAVNAQRPGTGQFTRFMNSCIAYFEEVYVWQIGNPNLASALIGKWKFVTCKHPKYGVGLTNKRHTGSGSVPVPPARE